MFDHHTTIATSVQADLEPVHTERSGLSVQVPPLVRSVPPTGMRLTKILGQFRIYLRSVANQIGPDAMLEFVKQALRQDFQNQENRNG
jgi:hypothetical protein